WKPRSSLVRTRKPGFELGRCHHVAAYLDLAGEERADGHRLSDEYPQEDRHIHGHRHGGRGKGTATAPAGTPGAACVVDPPGLRRVQVVLEVDLGALHLVRPQRSGKLGEDEVEKLVHAALAVPQPGMDLGLRAARDVLLDRAVLGFGGGLCHGCAPDWLV